MFLQSESQSAPNQSVLLIPKNPGKSSLSDQEEEEDKNVTRSRDFGGHAHSGDGEWSVQGERGASIWTPQASIQSRPFVLIETRARSPQRDERVPWFDHKAKAKGVQGWQPSRTWMTKTMGQKMSV